MSGKNDQQSFAVHLLTSPTFMFRISRRLHAEMEDADIHVDQVRHEIKLVLPQAVAACRTRLSYH